MVASYTTVKWQLILYFLRLILLIINCGVIGYSDLLLGFFLPMMIFGCMNDVYILTWDIYTYGSFFATPIPQILTSLALTAFLIMQTLFVSAAAIPLFLINVLILVMICSLWVRGPSESWKRGIKDLQMGKKGVFVLGKTRPVDDLPRKLARNFLSWPKDIIYRRIEEVESARYAMTRNITAILLLSILVVQSVVLVHGVINEKFLVRETWRKPEKYPTSGQDLSHGFCGKSIFFKSDLKQTWNIHSSLSFSTNVSTNDPLSTATCDGYDFDGFSVCDLSPSSSQLCSTAAANIAMVAVNVNNNNTSSNSTPGRIWLSTSPFPGWSSSITTPYDHGIHFLPGYQLFGLVELFERRVISRGFIEMWGFSPSYSVYGITSVDWMGRIPLNNASTAQVTLQFASPEAMGSHDGELVRVIEDYRQHTFLDALSSIGGLLAILQGFHVLCFGRPLFWGMFGSKLINPFGTFGTVSTTLRERMIQRYGFSPDSGTFTPEGLSLFLGDFVLDVGPLKEKDDEDTMAGLESRSENVEVSATGTVFNSESIPLNRRSTDGDPLEEDKRKNHSVVPQGTW